MSEVLQRCVVIIGGGPAGMAAARELHACGVDDVLILDEGPKLGGQIFRQLPDRFGSCVPPRYRAPSHTAGHRLIHDVEAAQVEVRAGVSVWDVAPGRVDCEADGQGFAVCADYIVLATGAMDRTLPFPGWTLPGAVTPGGAQVMVRGQMLRPGRRAVVAGTGPLLLPTVTALLSSGVEVVALLEANRPGAALRASAGVLLHAHRLREALHYAKALLGARVRMRWGHAVFSAHGQDALQSVSFGRVDRQGRPVPGTEREVRADVLCVGYGLTPNVELPIRMGCAMRHREVDGGWVPEHDEDLQTSVPRVYVAGETAGIGGADVAMVEGRLVGRSIAVALGRARAFDLQVLRNRRRAERRAARAMLSAFPVLPGLYHLARPDTIVCRCEDVTLGEVQAAADVYGRDVRSVKMATRAGMGPCQARICHRIVGGMLRERCGGVELPTPCPSVQVPVKPVLVRTVAGRPAG